MFEKLPTKLNKEPLIDAIFEMRFGSSISASSILPGYLFTKLGEGLSIEQLPTNQLPKALLDSDPNLRFAPLVRLHWNNFLISIGDRSLSVSCKVPYPGWKVFKTAIIEVISNIKSVLSIYSIQRFSMKYIDLIPVSGLAEQVSAINGKIKIGNHDLQNEIFSLRIELPENDLLHAVQIMNSVTATLPDGSTREGVIVDIDTINNVNYDDLADWDKKLIDKLDLMHSSNKKMFFNCLHSSTVASLDPVYD